MYFWFVLNYIYVYHYSRRPNEGALFGANFITQNIDIIPNIFYQKKKTNNINSLFICQKKTAKFFDYV